MATKLKKTVAQQRAADKKSRAKKSAAKKSAKRAVKRSAVKLADVKTRKHKTQRYVGMGYDVGDEATRTTNRRHAVEAMVAAGCTLGALVAEHGQLGRRNTAKHFSRGGIIIAGLKSLPGEKPVKSDAVVAARIAKLPDSTKLRYKPGYVPRNSATK